MTVAYQAHRAAGSAAAFALDPVRIAPVRLRRRLQRRAPFLIELLNAPFRQHLPEPERQARGPSLGARARTYIGLLRQERKQLDDLLAIGAPAVFANLEHLRVLHRGRAVLAVPLSQRVPVALGDGVAAGGEAVADLLAALDLLLGIGRHQRRRAERAAFVELRYQGIDGVQLPLDHRVD